MATKWYDSKDFLKNMIIDGVMYGFAGSNAMFKIFLLNYCSKETSDFVLDTVVQLAKKNRVQFFIIRYDGEELKLFAYSPPADGSPEIFRISADPCINRSAYAIGSGKFSKEYKKNKGEKSAQVPIRRIISANMKGLKCAGMLDLDKRMANGIMTIEESKMAFQACNRKGGDLFTGGDVNMSQNATREKIMEQVAIMDRMDQQAKAVGSVCASPVDANLEVEQLRLMGLKAVSDHRIEDTEERKALFRRMQETLSASI